METYGLEQYGITGIKEVVYNPTYEQLFEAEMDPALEGFEKGQMTELGAVNVMTGIYTGRSPKDKFIVMDENSKDTVWWTSDEFKNDNKPASQEAWKACKDLVCDGCVLRHQPRLPHGHPLHHGGGVAGPLCQEYVHRPHRRGAEEF